MLRYTFRRLGLAVLVAFTVSVVTFAFLRLSSDPAAAMAGEGATAENIEFIRKHYGFDRPLPVQYWEWATRAIKGDFGQSYYLKTDVASVIFERAPVTMKLGVSALSLALVVAIPLGVIAAIRPNTLIDRFALTIAVIGQAMPPFWFALVMMYVLGVSLRLLPVSGSDSWKHFVMPSIALGYYAMPVIMRLTRAGMLEVMASDYIRTARAKGLRTWSVLFKHTLRNAILPVVSVSAVQLGFMLGGSIILETIFQLNGLGRLAWQSIKRNDLEMMQAIVLVMASLYVILMFIGDLINAFLDPRIRVR
jgi:peptide/nickel transport system permease protein